MGVDLMDPPRNMAKKKAETAQIRLAVDVIQSARIVAAYRDMEPGDFLSDFLRPILAKLEADEAAKRARTKGGKP